MIDEGSFSMETQEKVLYHQIHPIKLFTDVSTSLISLYLLWQEYLAVGWLDYNLV